MGNNYIFSLQPTFTQGLLLGQASILALLCLILRYLFLGKPEQHPFESPSYHPRFDKAALYSKPSKGSLDDQATPITDSAEWLNTLLLQCAQVYRSRLRDHSTGPIGDEIARRRVEEFANRVRPPTLLDHITVHTVDLGHSAPRLYSKPLTKGNSDIDFNVNYQDSISISLSTTYLFNYPKTSFARLPVSLTISLSNFNSTLRLTPPASDATHPVVHIKIPQDSNLELDTTSLMGSRAKLANVPKLHELIQHQVRRVLASHAKWTVPLPGLHPRNSTVQEIKEELKEGLQ